MDYFCISRAATFAALAFTVTTAVAGEPLTIRSDHQVLFGGVRQTLHLTVSNAASVATSDTIHHRLFQLGHRLYVPTGAGVKWREVAVPAGGTLPLSLELDVPEIKARTRFRLAFFAGDEKRIGTLEITALPDNQLDTLKALARRERVGLWDPEDRLRPAFDKLAIRPMVLSTRWNAEDFAGDLIIAVHAKGDRDRLDEKNATFAILKRRGCSVLCLLQDHRPDLPLPLIATGDSRDGSLVYASFKSVADLATAAAQLRLSQLIEFARSREPLSLLNQYEE